MERILIVEDEEKIREELSTALERKGYACILIDQSPARSRQRRLIWCCWI